MLDEDKTEILLNVRTPQNAHITVTKTVTGEMGNKTDTFYFDLEGNVANITAVDGNGLPVNPIIIGDDLAIF